MRYNSVINKDLTRMSLMPLFSAVVSLLLSLEQSFYKVCLVIVLVYNNFFRKSRGCAAHNRKWSVFIFHRNGGRFWWRSMTHFFAITNQYYVVSRAPDYTSKRDQTFSISINSAAAVLPWQGDCPLLKSAENCGWVTRALEIWKKSPMKINRTGCGAVTGSGAS